MIPTTKITIPRVQSNDRLINQLQQNLIDGINKLQVQVLNAGTVIGESKTAYISVTQFQDQLGPGWVSQDGASCIGSSYQELTGNRNVPNVVPPAGAILMIRIN